MWLNKASDTYSSNLNKVPWGTPIAITDQLYTHC